MIHTRYHKFIEYGDSQNFQDRLVELRNSFDDLNEKTWLESAPNAADVTLLPGAVKSMPYTRPGSAIPSGNPGLLRPRGIPAAGLSIIRCK